MGKVDMVAATINAMVLWDQNIKDGLSVYEADKEDREDAFIFL